MDTKGIVDISRGKTPQNELVAQDLPTLIIQQNLIIGGVAVKFQDLQVS
jgi:hypothetical protein